MLSPKAGDSGLGVGGGGGVVLPREDGVSRYVFFSCWLQEEEEEEEEVELVAASFGGNCLLG